MENSYSTDNGFLIINKVYTDNFKIINYTYIDKLNNYIYIFNNINYMYYLKYLFKYLFVIILLFIIYKNYILLIKVITSLIIFLLIITYIIHIKTRHMKLIPYHIIYTKFIYIIGDLLKQFDKLYAKLD